MMIAIHDSKIEGYYSNRWIEYCQEAGIPHKVVNAYDNDIVEQVRDCNAFMWHHSHTDYRDVMFAKQLLYSLQNKGMQVYPNFNTVWHFDDKVGQKYLLEAMDAPMIPSYAFYEKDKALEWLDSTVFPVVFKLRGGSSSNNVRLVRNKKEAVKLIHRAFGKGFSQFDATARLKERYRNFKLGRETFFGLIKGVARIFITPTFAKMKGKEKGYVYFQKFIPHNTFDTRVVVIGGKRALAERRFVRTDDFRASGSGEFSYEDINLDAIKLAFEASKKLNLQSVAFDFVMDENRKPLIVELSYGFGVGGIGKAPGYWDEHLCWHEEKLTIEKWIVEDLIQIGKS